MKFRADIDGLRALAILAVVGSHVEIPGLAGGFVGVDAFFVISGFLITSLLRREQDETGQIDLVAFFARRVRRLAPAMAVVLLTVLTAGFLLLSPDGEQQGLASSGFATTTFVSNIYFGLSRVGYFIPVGQFQPLLHTWSLGVEEQFYLVWPLLLILFAAAARRLAVTKATLIVWILALGTAASLTLCFATLDSAQSVGFYAFPTRAWELGAGALLAFAPKPSTPRTKLGLLLVLAGLTMFVAVVWSYRDQNMFTATPSLIAVVSAVLIIAGGGLSRENIASRALGSTPMVAIGKLSYSWYLWHWPLLAFGRIASLGEPSLPRDLLVAFASLGLAAVTWRFVEQPARKQRLGMFSTDRRSLFSGAAILFMCALVAGTLWLWSERQLARSAQAQAAVAAAEDRVTLSRSCEEVTSIERLIAADCLLGARAEGPIVLLIGDSHARHLAPGLADIATTAGVRVLPVVKSSCVPSPEPQGAFLGAAERRQRQCARFYNAVLSELAVIKEAHDIRGVIVAGMWSRDRGWKDALPDYVSTLRRLGLQVSIVLDVPAYSYSAPRCYAHYGAARCGAARQKVERVRDRDASLLRRIASGDPGIRIWDPLQSLCTPDRCGIVWKGEVLYSDRNHLNYAGSRHVVRSMPGMLSWTARATTVQTPYSR
jgi:peptidoglycan/LPS O-acetylase OafA/YrhL